jgi:hypothetical protein
MDFHGQSAAEITPGMARKIKTRMKNRRTVAQSMVENRWMLDVPLPLSAADVLDCIVLRDAVESVARNEALDDVFTWSCSASRKYTAKSTYDHLSRGAPNSRSVMVSGKAMRCPDARISCGMP